VKRSYLFEKDGEGQEEGEGGGEGAARAYIFLQLCACKNSQHERSAMQHICRALKKNTKWTVYQLGKILSKA